ncbi:MAG: hypothetical protein C4589_09525 [Peptococcaceae bacterium]|nr:MAG: hypothetical protein C4589_09525 [Peptococcaceae bacterium]
MKSNFDPRVIQWITGKEEIIASVPFSFAFLGHELSGIRKFKSGKLRILYVLSEEKPDIWNTPPEKPEIMFLYVDLRKDETYKEALKFLRKHGIVQ